MLKIKGHSIYRGNKLVGRLDGNSVLGMNGKALGYFQENEIRDAKGNKLAYVSGNHLYPIDEKYKVQLTAINEKVENSEVVSEMAKCAIYVLFED